MSASAEAAHERPRAAVPLLAPAAARVLAFAVLGAWGAIHWAQLITPPATGRMMAAVAVAVALTALLRGSRRAIFGLPPRAVTAGIVALASIVAAVAIGVPVGLLAPTAWGELLAGLALGIGSLPDLRIPYDGADPWPAVALLAGGSCLLTGAAVASARGTAAGRGGAVVALAVLYAVPAVELTPSGQILRGVVFAALVVAFLRLERVRRTAAPAAAAMLAVGLAAGTLAAPRLDGPRPWIDYEAIAGSLGSSTGVRYDFNHRYGPLRWPRDGRELLRIQTPERAYWKAVNLDVFDGIRWAAAGSRFGASLSDELPPGYRARRGWNHRLRVTFRALRSRELVGAGTTLSIQRPPSAAVAAPAPGTFVLERTPQRGDSYTAAVYVPRPDEGSLRGAGTGYPALAGRYLELGIPRRSGSRGADPRQRVLFGAWGSGSPATVLADGSAPPAEEVLAASPYQGAWELSRRLAARSGSPYEYSQAVLAHLSRGFTYDEAAATHRYPLASFLGSDRTGYCQQFSGAMAMLLRMGGVPARAVGGFSPGSYSRQRREWVVRDLDAHSWVEAYFPGSGWVTFDPTPIAAPARSQFGFVPVGAPAGQRGGPQATRGDRPEPGSRAAPAGDPRGGGRSRRWILGAVLVAVLVAAARRVVRRPTRVPEDDPQLAELQRALRRAGWGAQPPTTLRVLERRLVHEPAAADYVAALRSARYGGATATPTPTQRRALRRALAHGRGGRGWVRAVWALPPRLGRPGAQHGHGQRREAPGTRSRGS